jgi:hypothetical protein
MISVTSNNAVLPLLFHVFYGEIEVYEQTAFSCDPLQAIYTALNAHSLNPIPKSLQTTLV